MLLEIRAAFAKCLSEAMPDFNRFFARVTKVNKDELPFVNLYFHRDHLVEKLRYHENREVRFEVDAVMYVGEDAEADLLKMRSAVERSIESSETLENLVDEWRLEDIDFGHEMLGEQRIGALSMTYCVCYQKPMVMPPEFTPIEAEVKE